jgi:WhiB family redox-sensing transcriptional regulator
MPGVVPVPGFKDNAPQQEQPSPDALSWREQSRCLNENPEIFFEGGGVTHKAKKICAGCGVRAQCLEFGLANDERFGIWGGLTRGERRALMKRRHGTDAGPKEGAAEEGDQGEPQLAG